MFDFFYMGNRGAGYPAHGVAVGDQSQAQSLCRTRFFWLVLGAADLEHWDLAWEPPPWQKDFRHAWPSQWQRDSGLYLIPHGSWTQTHYHDAPTVQRLPDATAWTIPHNISTTDFDFSWHPDHREPRYQYHFGTQWQATGGPIYHGDQGIKIVDQPRAKALPDHRFWIINDTVDTTSWDYSWHPDTRDPPYRYEFATTWHDVGGPIYAATQCADIKHMSWPRAQLLACHDHWHDVGQVNAQIDHSWRPHPKDPPYVYVFGNQWYDARRMPTKEYRVSGASERKYMIEPRAIVQADAQHWHQLMACDYDQSWIPDPGDPPYIYVFGNQWWPAEIMPTVEYHVPGATQRKFMDHPRCRLLPDRAAWHVPDDIDADAIDFSWCPDPHSPPYVYHFGDQRQDTLGVTYTVPGAVDIKLAGPLPLIDPTQTAVIQPEVFFIDHGNALSQQRYLELQKHMPGIQRIRFFQSLLDTLRRCANRCTTTAFWAVSSQNDYRQFDFTWRPEVWQRSMLHVFGTQWNKWSDTLLIDLDEFRRQAAWQKDLQAFYNLNFVQDQKVTAATDASDIVVIDHGNAETQIVIDELMRKSGRLVRVARYFDTYKDTLGRLLQDVPGEHVWIVSSICDYSTFDFSWQPEVWQRDMLHVFASNEQKFGDTFYAPVRRLREALPQLELLEWFDTVNYCTDQSVRRWPMPCVKHAGDCHVRAASEASWTAPLMLFTVRDAEVKDLPTVSLWDHGSKTVVPLDTGAESVIVPRIAATKIRTQFYDYPYIDQSHKHRIGSSPQDVIFISYDEPEADRNWHTLKSVCSRAQRLHGVEGMETALEAAADMSSTPWYFAVFAKTSLDSAFDFSYQPDRMQQPKHYIFNCRNPLNGLEYGHMAVVLYNCEGIRQTNRANSWGIDYTMSWPTESIPILSCHGNFNTTAYHTWRTAFRETAKLAWFESQQHTIEGQYRLRTWLDRAEGQHSEWCLQGARDGVEFFETSGGDLAVIKQSFRWQWLREYFVQRHGELY